MDVSTVRRKRRRLTIALAVMGFVIAAVIWAYSELTDSSPPKPFNSTLWTAFMILCPTSVLSIPLIDIEPGSVDFAIMWSVIGLLNSGLYAVVAMIIGRFRWKPDGQTVARASGAV
jgi:hypothetical protein